MTDPLIYDIRDGTYTHATHQPFREWATTLGININATYRIAINTRTLTADVSEYLTDSGHRYCNIAHDHREDPDACRPATRTYQIVVPDPPPQLPNRPASGCDSCDAWYDAVNSLGTDLRVAHAAKGECAEVVVLRMQWAEAFGLSISHTLTHLTDDGEAG